jgi:multiple antibiotic resistance protein
MKEFWLCFVPLFVAVDAFGVLPMFIALTETLDPQRTRRVVVQSVITATAVALAFLSVGRLLLRLLGITIPDFMIAGGTLLFALSVTDLLMLHKHQRVVDPDSLGAVPVGVPLIVGPAVLTTSILLLDQHGRLLPVAALVLNILIAGAVFWTARPIHRMLGKAGSKTISKLASILLASIAVMMVRRGIVQIWRP